MAGVFDERVVPSSMRMQILPLIQRAILEGELGPGRRINESVIGRRLGVSQTPVREALLRLEGERCVNSSPNRGFRVPPLTANEVRDVYPVLAELEALALRSGPAAKSDLLNELEALNKKIRRTAKDPSATIELDGRWHRTLLSGCPNRLLLELVELTRRAAFRYEYAYFREQSRAAASAEQHAQIVAALREGNRRLAIRHLRDNWLIAIERLVPWLEQLRS